MTVTIKTWFINKIDLPVGIKAFKDTKLEVIAETEKAYKGTIECYSVDGEWEGTRTVWVPKSCTLAEGEVEEPKAYTKKTTKKATKKTTKKAKAPASDAMKFFATLSHEDKMDFVTVNGKQYVRKMAEFNGLI